MSPKPWENAEGYADPTAYNAIKKVSAEGHEALDAKVNTLIKVLKFIIAESGFELVTQQRTVKLQRLDNRISQSLIHPKP